MYKHESHFSDQQRENVCEHFWATYVKLQGVIKDEEVNVFD